jgi:hypothetical protein
MTKNNGTGIKMRTVLVMIAKSSAISCASKPTADRGRVHIASSNPYAVKTIH